MKLKRKKCKKKEGKEKNVNQHIFSFFLFISASLNDVSVQHIFYISVKLINDRVKGSGVEWSRA